MADDTADVLPDDTDDPAARPAVIPAPRTLDVLDGPPFVLGPATRVVVEESAGLIGVAVLAADLIGRTSGRATPLQFGEDRAPGAIVIRLVAGRGLPDGPEAYTLDVSEDRIVLSARAAEGAMRGMVTLRQLVQGTGSSAYVPAVHVADAPRFAWRGLSIDVARHFFSVEDLKVVVGMLAHYKLNVLHLHLTDDQGWRIALPSRPALTEVSSGTAVDGDPGGFYSAVDYGRLVDHAAARGVTIVPEIDVPGHVNAALHAYGELSPDGRPTEVYTGIEVGFSRLHADLPATTRFLRDVFRDVAAMTPGEYVHIGGDEVLTMDPAEYARLVATASDAVRASGKRVVGWQEIAHTDLPAGTVVQYWDTRVDPEPFVAAAQAGAKLLMSPGSTTYLDMKYDASTELGLEWAGHIEVRDSYEWEPTTLIPGLPPGAVIGVEAAVWTETLHDLDELTHMLLPRLAAVAEVAWSEPERRDWDDFRARLAQQGPFWDRLGVRWYRSPQVDWPAAADAAGDDEGTAG